MLRTLDVPRKPPQKIHEQHYEVNEVKTENLIITENLRAAQPSGFRTSDQTLLPPVSDPFTQPKSLATINKVEEHFWTNE